MKIEPSEVRKGDRIRVVLREDPTGITTSDEYTVVSVVGDRVFFSSGTYDYQNLEDDPIDHVELLDRPKREIKVGDRVQRTRHGVTVSFEVGFISAAGNLYAKGGVGDIAYNPAEFEVVD